MEIYFDNEFCQRIVDSIHNGSFSKRDEFECALKIYDLLDCETLKVKNIPISKQDLKRMFIDKVSFSNLAQLGINYDSISNPFSLMFLESADTKQIRKEKDQNAYNFEELFKHKDKFFDNKTRLVKEDIHSWGQIASRLLRFKYLIVCDNYIFINNKNNISEMIQSFFKGQNKSRRYEILINTSGRKQFPNYSSDSIDALINEKLKWIHDDLKDKIGLNNFSISIMLSEKYHDRHIFTNCQVFESSNSFSIYFNCDAKLHEFSFINKTENDIVFKKYLSDLRKLKREYNKQNRRLFSTGDFSLFNYIE